MFLFLGAVLIDVGRDDRGMNDVAETVIGAHALFPNHSCLLSKVSTTPTELFGNRDTQQPSISSLIPHIPVNLMVFRKTFKVGHNFIGKENTRKVRDRFYIVGHPG